MGNTNSSEEQHPPEESEPPSSFDVSKLKQNGDEISSLAKKKFKKALLSGDLDVITQVLESFNASILNISETIDANSSVSALHLVCQNFSPPRPDILSVLCCRPGIGINKVTKNHRTPLIILLQSLEPYPKLPELDLKKMTMKKFKLLQSSHEKKVTDLKVVQESAVQILLHNGADATIADLNFCSDNCLQIALKKSKFKIAVNIIEACPIPAQKFSLITHRNTDGANALHILAAIPDLSVINYILKIAVQLDDANFLTENHVECQQDSILTSILEARDAKNLTPFSQAVLSGNLEVVDLLMQRGSQIDVLDNMNQNVFIIAKKTLPEKLSKIMVSKIETVRVQREKWRSILENAEKEKLANLQQEVLKPKDDEELKDAQPDRPLNDAQKYRREVNKAIEFDRKISGVRKDFNNSPLVSKVVINKF